MAGYFTTFTIVRLRILCHRQAQLSLFPATRCVIMPEGHAMEWKAASTARKLRSAEPQWIAAKRMWPSDFTVYPSRSRSPQDSFAARVCCAPWRSYYLAEGHACRNGRESLIFSVPQR